MSPDPFFRPFQAARLWLAALFLLLLPWPRVFAAPAGPIPIGDYVWQDFNGNGLQDDGEDAGLAGVGLRLYRDNGDGQFQPQIADMLVGQTVSGADGSYHLSAPSSGGYWVEVDASTLPAGLVVIAGDQSHTSPHFLTVWSAQGYSGVDFGYSPRAVLWGQVFYDYDLDGDQGLGESGVIGAELCLYEDVNADTLLDPEDPLLHCLLSDTQGGFAFADLLRRHYLVRETPRSGVGHSTISTLPAFVDPWQAAGQALAPIGNVQLGGLGGVLFVDVNGNQMREPDEAAGISGATLRLQHLASGALFTTTSDATGRYLFADLMPGAYALTLHTYPAGYNPTNAADRSVQVVWGSSDLTQDFSFASPTSITLAHFAVEVVVGGQRVTWQTSAEEGQDGFIILRSASETGAFVPVSGFIPAANTPAGASYEWLDLSAGKGVYWYQLESLPDGARFGPVSAAGSEVGAIRLFIPFVRR